MIIWRNLAAQLQEWTFPPYTSRIVHMRSHTSSRHIYRIDGNIYLVLCVLRLSLTGFQAWILLCWHYKEDLTLVLPLFHVTLYDSHFVEQIRLSMLASKLLSKKSVSVTNCKADDCRSSNSRRHSGSWESVEYSPVRWYRHNSTDECCSSCSHIFGYLLDKCYMRDPLIVMAMTTLTAAGDELSDSLAILHSKTVSEGRSNRAKVKRKFSDSTSADELLKSWR